MAFKARIKERSFTGSKIDLSIFEDGAEERGCRINVDDLIDRESRTPEFKLVVAKFRLLQFLRQKQTRRLTPEQCVEFAEKDLDL